MLERGRTKMTWNVSEFVLDPRFAGKCPPYEAFPCQTVEEMPAEFSCQRSGETIAPSLRENASLLVSGISPETFAQLTSYTSWSPYFSYRLSFTDERTGEVKQFDVTSQMDTQEQGAARFGLPFDPERDVPSLGE
jgi:hypothetical protein